MHPAEVVTGEVLAERRPQFSHSLLKAFVSRVKSTRAGQFRVPALPHTRRERSGLAGRRSLKTMAVSQCPGAWSLLVAYAKSWGVLVLEPDWPESGIMPQSLPL
jgi:hypothetical protein